MKKISLIVIVFAALFCNQANAQCNVNLLTNPSFETPVQPTIGNNLLTVFVIGDWTMTGGPFNVIKTNGTPYGGGPDNAQNGTQYIDITSAGGTVYQNFTIAGPAQPVAFSGYFSSREQAGAAYGNWVGSIDIINTTTNTVVATSSTRAFTNADGAAGAQEIWYYLFGNTTLSAGNYRYVANFGNYGNFDNAFVAQNCVLANGITELSGNYVNGKRILNWKVEDQLSTYKFEIEASKDGRNFTNIGAVDINSSDYYNFVDEITTGCVKMYYRIKTISLNGSFKYSSIVTISGKGFGISFTPNPVVDNLLISGIERGEGTILIIDVVGRIILKKEISNIQSLSLDLSALNKGMYFVEYRNSNGKSTQQFFKQ